MAHIDPSTSTPAPTGALGPARLPARAACAGLLLASLTTLAAAHDMMYVGRTADGHLTIFIEDGLLPNMMVQSIYNEFPGWIQTELGMETIGEDVPDYNLYTISSQANVQLVLLAADEGIVLQKEEFAGPVALGESYLLGHPYFHQHPLWNIVDPRIDQLFSLTFKLHDATGLYADSAPFTLTFGCTPCPADFDHSVFVDVDDFVAFVLAFEAGDEAADFDQSGFVDTDDFDGFVRAFEAGC